MMMKFVLLSFLCLWSTASAQSLRSATPVEDVAPSHQRRELFDFWQLIMAVGGPPCPPGPLGDHCRHHKNNGSSGGSSSSSYGGGSTSSTSSSNSGSYSNGSSNYDNSGASSKSANASPDQSGHFVSGKATAASWMLMGAAIAASIAAIAIVFGQRKNTPEAHPLTGSVARRAALFGAFADSALCANGSRTVEMTASTDNQSAMV